MWWAAHIFTNPKMFEIFKNFLKIRGWLSYNFFSFLPLYGSTFWKNIWVQPLYEFFFQELFWQLDNSRLFCGLTQYQLWGKFNESYIRRAESSKECAPKTFLWFQSRRSRRSHCAEINNFVPKGQLISKWLFGAIVSTKKPAKFF